MQDDDLVFRERVRRSGGSAEVDADALEELDVVGGMAFAREVDDLGLGKLDSRDDRHFTGLISRVVWGLRGSCAMGSVRRVAKRGREGFERRGFLSDKVT